MTVFRAPKNITTPDGSNPVSGPDWTARPVTELREFLDTPCSECVIEVSAWRESGSVYVTLLSPHTVAQAQSWRGRLQNARYALQGRVRCYFDLSTVEQCEDLIASLQRARDAVFPEDPSHAGDEVTLDIVLTETESRPRGLGRFLAGLYEGCSRNIPPGS